MDEKGQISVALFLGALPGDFVRSRLAFPAVK
jgi:hypothetical protein